MSGWQLGLELCGSLPCFVTPPPSSLFSASFPATQSQSCSYFWFIFLLYHLYLVTYQMLSVFPSKCL